MGERAKRVRPPLACGLSRSPESVIVVQPIEARHAMCSHQDCTVAGDAIALACTIWFSTLKSRNAKGVAVFRALAPIFGAARLATLLHETMNLRVVAGGAAISIGVVLVTHRASAPRQLQTAKCYQAAAQIATTDCTRGRQETTHHHAEADGQSPTNNREAEDHAMLEYFCPISRAIRHA